jgi:hypothetical protein
MKTPKYETNKYRSYREAFEGGVSETMKMNNAISVEELTSELNTFILEYKNQGNLDIDRVNDRVVGAIRALHKVKDFVNSKINQERNE